MQLQATNAMTRYEQGAARLVEKDHGALADQMRRCAGLGALGWPVGMTRALSWLHAHLVSVTTLGLLLLLAALSR